MHPVARHALAVLACLLSFPVSSADGDWQGRPLAEYLERLAGTGLNVIYSSELVRSDMILAQEPPADDTRAALAAVLDEFGLGLEDGPAGSLLVVRAGKPRNDLQAARAAAPPPIEEIVVTSSLHRFDYSATGGHSYLERQLATRIPTAGEEAVRLTHRLPGTAAGGVSAQSYIRGGEANEVLFLLDGLRLYEPYHLKDFQSITTIVNPSAIDGIDFYTGGYPVRYGDRMSGVMSMDLRKPVRDRETEVGLSFFNASLLSLGYFANDRGDWLASIRRGNLDLIFDVVDPERGSPEYQDLLLHAGYDFGPKLRLSANLLASHDRIALVDADIGEVANARYDNRVVWFRWDADWSAKLASETILSASRIENRRNATLETPGIVSATLDDARDFTVTEINQDWRYTPSAAWMLSFGYGLRDTDADYDFSSEKTVFPPFDTLFGNAPASSEDTMLAAGGAQYHGYAELRWQVMHGMAVDLGIRWDQQNYTTLRADEQYSPRVSVLYRLGDATDLRLGWGRFYQAQEINELQVSDGITTFFPAQRAEHIVGNLTHVFTNGMDLELSLYRKRFRTLRPRFENAFNSLVLIPELQIDRVRIEPVSAEARGAEIMLSQGDAEESLLWWLSYAWSEVEDTLDTGKVKRSWDQSHTVKGGVSWQWGPWNFSAAGEVHTGWPKTELVADTSSGSLYLQSTNRNSLRYSVFHSLDARVSRDFRLSHGELTAFLEVTNLYDRSNPCCTEYRLVGLSQGNGAVEANETTWLPLLPSLGFVWRF